jgi:ABC-2 type transport system ATP-binding protein
VTTDAHTLAVDGIEKRFGKAAVLRGASVAIGRGEIVGVVGENGAGKTALLKVIVGLLGADRGTIQIAGRYGYCPQDPLLPPPQSRCPLSRGSPGR